MRLKLRYFRIVLFVASTFSCFSQNEITPTPESTLKNSEPIFPDCEHSINKGYKTGCSYLKIRKFIDENLQKPEIFCLPTFSVEIEYIINKDGFTDSIEVVASDSPLVNEYAIQVIKDLPQMSPALKDGVPVDFSDSIRVIFSTDETANQYSDCDGCSVNDPVTVSMVQEFLACYDFSLNRLERY